MKSINKFFPINRNLKKGLGSLLWVIILYIFVGFLFGVANFFLGGIPIVGAALGIICWVWDAYAIVGILFAIIQFISK